MFVRFRQTKTRLQASLIETRWNGGKVHSEHVASLGSVPVPLHPAGRIAFWTKLHQRLEALSNRVDPAQQAAILTAIHARIPMPTQGDQQAVQLDHAQADARFWQSWHETATGDLNQRKELAASAQRAVAECEKSATDFGSFAQEAKERLAAVERGEAVAVPKPMTRKELLKACGMTEADERHAHELSQVANAMEARGVDFIEALCRDAIMVEDRWQRRTVRKLHRDLQRAGMLEPE
jgi:hypothetical protein